MAQISYTNKVALNENPEIANINKVTDDDMNEIKQVVNANYNNTIVISDTQPTSEDNKIWIDTGEVQNLGSEVHIGDTINSKIGLNILFSEKYNKAQVEIGKSWQGATNTKRMRFVVPITPNKDYSVLFKNNSTATINSYSIVETAEAPTTSSSPIFVVNVNEGVRNYYKANSSTNYLTIQIDCTDNITQTIVDNILVSIWFKNPAINVYGEDIYVKGQNEVYSTQEQVIGTWINGKPIYRKVIELGSLPNNTTKEVSTGLTHSNIRLTKLYGVCYTSTGDSQTFIGDMYTRFELRTNNTIRITTTANYSNYAGYAVIEYTKTTD